MSQVRKRRSYRSANAFDRAARVEAWARQGGRCLWCLSQIARDEITREHLHAKSHGGSDESHNIAAACVPCNSARGNLSASKWRSMIRDGAISTKWRGVSFSRRTCQAVYRLNKRADSACARILRFAK